MLKLFGVGKSDHPLGDIKDARRVVAELPRADPAKALEEVTHWIESVRVEETLRPDHRAAVLQLLDEAAQDSLRRLSREYLSSPRLSKQREHVLWTGIHRFWKESALGVRADPGGVRRRRQAGRRTEGLRAAVRGARAARDGRAAQVDARALRSHRPDRSGR